MIPLKEKIKKILVEELNIQEYTLEEIGNDDLLFGKKFGLDSIDAVEILYQIEKHFGVVIRTMQEGRPALQSINTLAAFIEARRPR